VIFIKNLSVSVGGVEEKTRRGVYECIIKII